MCTLSLHDALPIFWVLLLLDKYASHRPQRQHLETAGHGRRLHHVQEAAHVLQKPLLEDVGGFLDVVETTTMTRSFKMLTLRAVGGVLVQQQQHPKDRKSVV